MRFEKEQRVTVPGSSAQAVIVDAVESVQGFPIYTLRWLDEAGETHTGSCGEGDLARANPSDEDLMAAADAKAASEDAIEHLINLRVAEHLRQIRLLDRANSRAKKKSPKRKR